MGKSSGSSVVSSRTTRSTTSKKSKGSSSRSSISSSNSLSVTARWSRIEEGVDLFHDFLLQTPSICLPASFRWSIALEARHCWLTGNCPGCAQLNEGTTCQRNGTAYSLLKGVKHTSCPSLPYDVTDRASWEKVRNMVHFVINHQARADAAWYQSTIKSLGHTSLISKKDYPIDSERRNVLMATLFSEILATICASHAIHVTYIATDKKVPALPQLPEDLDVTLPCTYQDVVTAGMLVKGKGIRWDSKTSHVPIITNKDINVQSEAWLALPPSTQDYLLANMVNMHPLCVLALSPRAMALCGAIIGGKVGLPETMGATPWKPLDKTKYCTQGGFTRADWELVQSVVGEAYDTVF